MVDGADAGLPSRGDWPLNFERLLAEHPALAEAFETLTGHVCHGSTLTDRQRTLLALRVAALRDAPYEWAHHVAAASASAMEPEEIVAIAAGADAHGWSDLERAMLRAVDELIAAAQVGHRTKAALAAHLTDLQMMDLVTTVGTYNLAAMATKTFDLPLEEN